MAMRILLRINLFVLFLFSAGLPSSGQEATESIDGQKRQEKSGITQPVYTTSRLTTGRPVIDGKLDDECWKHGTWAGDYHQFIPNEGAKPTWPTELNIQYDDKYLYIAFRAYDGEPEKIVRMSGARDEIVGDMVGVTFDSYRDYRTGFEFTITAWGQKVDLVLFNPMNWDFNWNAVWKGKVGTEDSAWVAELEVPFSQLRYSNKDDQVWGMHTWRWISRLQEESNWEIQSKTGPGMLYNFGELRGISGLKKSRRLEVMPFVLGDLNTVKPEAGNPFSENGRIWGGNAGLDAKIGISSSFTLDLTVNPDFGQVESDPSVMNLTAFETFYEEKRPFFLEGLTIFDYEFDNNTLFYSRRIGHAPSYQPDAPFGYFIDAPDKTKILSAMKFSGTTSKGLSVGFIQSITANEYARISDPAGNISRSIVEPLTSYSIGRIQKGYNAGNTVLGAMVTSSNRIINDKELEFLAGDAITGGIDFRHHWKDKEFFVEGNIIGSTVTGTAEAITLLQESSARYFQRPGINYVDYDTTRTSLSGSGGKIRIGKGSKGFWRYSTGVSWLSPGLELNDLGYMRLADRIINSNELSYFVNKPVSIFHTYSINLEQFNTWNFDGTFLGAGENLSASAEFVNNWSIRANLVLYSSAVDPGRLRGGPEMIMPNSLTASGKISSDPSKNVIASLGYRVMKFGNNTGYNREFTPGISIRPMNSLKVSVNGEFSRNDDELQYVRSIWLNDDKLYLLGRIEQKTTGLTIRFDLNISPELSLQYYGSPFISRGRYSGFKRITAPLSGNISDRYTLLGVTHIVDNIVGLDEDNDMLTDYGVTNPDFNFHQFRSNLVAKWEYRPGSFIYFVWSGERSGRNYDSGASYGESLKELGDVFPNNIFLVKLSYWFSL